MSTQKITKPKFQIQSYINYVVLTFCVIIFMQTCGTKGKIFELKNEIKKEHAVIDSLSDLIITKDEMIKLIKETPAWQTLRIEEISDKEKISINVLEQKQK